MAVVVPQPLDRIILALMTGEPAGDLWDVSASGAAAVEVPVVPLPARPSLATTGVGLLAGVAALSGLRGRLGLAQP